MEGNALTLLKQPYQQLIGNIYALEMSKEFRQQAELGEGKNRSEIEGDAFRFALDRRRPLET